MDDLTISDHLEYVEHLVAEHIDARVELVKSKAEIDGKLAQSYWRSDTKLPVILLPERITAQEIDDSLDVLALRGQVHAKPELMKHADEINSSLEYLKHLVLHEVAHIKNDWGQERETECDLWVYAQMHNGT